MRLIFLDTETTGIELDKDYLCEVCYKDGETLRTECFKPPVPMTTKSMSITHITDKMLEDKPAFAGSQMQKDLQEIFADDEAVLVCHNAMYDCGMLEKEDVKPQKKICTLKVARHLDGAGLIPEYNLQYLRYHYMLEIDGGAHDAKTDVLVLEAVFNKLMDTMRQTRKPDDQILEEMIEISKKPSLIRAFKFGKYNGRTLQEVSTIDRGYLQWLLGQKAADPDKEADWIYTLEYYLGGR